MTIWEDENGDRFFSRALDHGPEVVKVPLLIYISTEGVESTEPTEIQSIRDLRQPAVIAELEEILHLGHEIRIRRKDPCEVYPFRRKK